MTARNFSCYAFESFNAILSRMRKSKQKQGAVEDSLMRVAGQRSEVERMLRASSSDFMRIELAKRIKRTEKEIGSISETVMAKKSLETRTKVLLIDMLNGPEKEIQGMYKSSFDQTLGSDDVAVSAAAQHFHSLVKECSPRPIRYSSAKQGGRVNIGNTFVMVSITEGTVAAQIQWLFKKRLRLQTDGGDGEEVYYAHIRKIDTVESAVALGEGHPCLELMDEIGMLFGKPGDDGREMVIRLADIRCQLSVCPFKSIKGTFLGLKTL